MIAASLAGRTAVVTGASRGIGYATARELAGAGAWVGMVARNVEALSEAAGRAGGHAYPTDLTSAAGVERLVAKVESAIGGAPDILVNAAGAFALAPLVETDPEDFRRQLAANVFAPFLTIRAFLPPMLTRGSGHIVNVGSVAGRIALSGNAGYGASKYGLRGMHEVLAAELGGTGVRATLIDPAATDTSLWDAVDPDSRDDLPSRSQMLRPDDVARAIRFVLEQPSGVEVWQMGIRAT